MARLPNPGQDKGTWGGILNDFLNQSLNSDGSLKAAAIATAGGYTKPASGIPASDLDSLTQSNLAKASTSVQLGGDLTGTTTAPTIGKLQGTAVNASVPTNGQVLSYSTSASAWVPSTATSTVVTDATTSVKGIIQLAGDLTGTASGPTVANNAITNAKLDAATQAVVASVATKAPLASPIFTGTVTLPSTTPTNATDAATKSYVDSQVISGSTPDATTSSKGKIQLAGDLAGTSISPTLASTSNVNAIIAANSTVAGKLDTTTASSTFAPKASPTFTGNVTVPTPVNLNDATTKNYVDSAVNAVSSGGANATIALTAVAVRTTSSMAAINTIIPVDASSSTVTITLPAAPTDKSRIAIKKVDTSANTVSVVTSGSDVLNKAGGSTSLSLALLNQSSTLQYSASTSIWYALASDLSLSTLDSRYATSNSVTTAIAAQATTDAGQYAAASQLAAEISRAQTNEALKANSTDVPSIASLPTDGSTDIGPLIQAAYDAGIKLIKLSASTTYVWDTPVFIDKIDVLGGMVIEGNRAIIKLGPDLPTSSWSRDTTVKFAIFPNTLRTALSSGSVTVNDSTRATGSGGALRSLIVRDVTIDGQSTNAGFCFANRTPVTLENVTVYRMRVGSTWWSYADANTYINCYSRASSNPSQVVFEQYQAGDGLVVIGGKADSNVMFANVKTCRGGTFLGQVTCSMLFDSCSAINILGMHQEGQQSTSTMLQIKSSQITLTNCSLYENWSSTVSTITIDDSGSTQTGTELTFDNVVCNGLFTAATYNTAFSPFLTIIAASDNTRVVARDLKGTHTSTGIAGSWVDGAQPQFTSNVSGIQTIFDSPRGRAAIAGGTWTLRKIASSTYSIETTGEQLYVSKRHTTPTITQITTETGFTGGTMDTSTTYSYAVAMIDALGNYTNVSAETAYTPGTTAMTRLLVNSQSGSGTLVVWRKAASTGASTTPDSYCIVNIRSQRAYFYDTGNFLGGRAWITTSIPTPPVVNATVAKVMLNGVALPTSSDLSAASSSGQEVGMTEYNVAAWAVNPIAVTGSSALTSGQFKLVKSKASSSTTPPSVIMNISVATSVATTIFKIGVYASDGSQIGSASDSTVGSATGQISLSLTMNRALVAGEVIYLGLIWVGTGTLSPSTTGTLGANIGLNNSQATMYRVSTLSSQTDLPASISFSSYNSAGTISQILLR